MLILTRRLGESVLIGDDVKVKVLSVRGGQVRLGIEAPREIQVNRDEVVDPYLKEERREERGAARTSVPYVTKVGRRSFPEE